MKILHTADNHHDFFATRLGSMQIVDGKNAIYEERVARTENIVSVGMKEKVDFFVFAGDFFNKIKPPPQEYADAMRIFDWVAEKKPVIIIAGNHDELTAKGCPLSVIEGRNKNIHVAWTIDSFELDGVEFVLAPWGTDMDAIKGRRDVCKSYRPKVLIYHVGVRMEGLHWAEVEGENGTVDFEQIEQLGFDAVLMGHYHGQTAFKNIGHPVTCYAGSPEMYNFGEEKQKKGFLIWTIDDNAKKFSTFESREVPYPSFKTYSIEEFLDPKETFFDGFVRVLGEASQEEIKAVFDKGKDFECRGFRPSLKNKMKIEKVFTVKGQSNKDILRNYLKGKKVDGIDNLMKIDISIEEEI